VEVEVEAVEDTVVEDTVVEDTVVEDTVVEDTVEVDLEDITVEVDLEDITEDLETITEDIITEDINTIDIMDGITVALELEVGSEDIPFGSTDSVGIAHGTRDTILVILGLYRACMITYSTPRIFTCWKKDTCKMKRYWKLVLQNWRPKTSSLSIKVIVWSLGWTTILQISCGQDHRKITNLVKAVAVVFYKIRFNHKMELS